MTQHEIFYSDKSSWFTETDDGNRIWNILLVSNFWFQIKKYKIEKGDFNFENIVFPSCSTTITEQLNVASNYFIEIFSNTEKVIDKPITFKNCRFQGSFLFLGNLKAVGNYPASDITFNDLKFQNCHFEKEFRLQSQKINGILSISNCIFFGESIILLSFFDTININKNQFKQKFLYHGNKNLNNMNISNCLFDKNFQLSANLFNSQFTINTAEFNNKVSFHSNTYNTIGSIAYVQFNHESFIKTEIYNNFQFIDVEFSSKKHLLEEIKIMDNGILTFRNQIFPKNVIIRNCDCTKIRFLNSDISEIKFSSCNWNLSERMILLNEKELKKKEILEIQNLENLYRQLKRNFENDRDWELAGKAYISEMTFRQLRLKIQRNYFSWFIYWFYDFFGGYTQNYIKPMIWFIIFTFLIFPGYYCYFESPISYNEIFIKSIAASSPWLETKLKYENWGILAFQKTICTILLTFIILALRKRFKE